MWFETSNKSCHPSLFHSPWLYFSLLNWSFLETKISTSFLWFISIILCTPQPTECQLAFVVDHFAATPDFLIVFVSYYLFYAYRYLDTDHFLPFNLLTFIDRIGFGQKRGTRFVNVSINYFHEKNTN